MEDAFGEGCSFDSSSLAPPLGPPVQKSEKASSVVGEALFDHGKPTGPGESDLIEHGKN